MFSFETKQHLYSIYAGPRTIWSQIKSMHAQLLKTTSFYLKKKWKDFLCALIWNTVSSFAKFFGCGPAFLFFKTAYFAPKLSMSIYEYITKYAIRKKYFYYTYLKYIWTCVSLSHSELLCLFHKNSQKRKNLPRYYYMQWSNSFIYTNKFSINIHLNLF